MLNSSSSKACRAIVSHPNYLGQESSEIPFAVKGLGRDMSTPSQPSQIKMKGVLRYLKCVLRAVLHFDYQELPKSLVEWSDSDFAGCVKSRKPTSAISRRDPTHRVEMTQLWLQDKVSSGR